MIGIVPVKAIDRNKEGEGGNIIEFFDEFEVNSNNGLFNFGNVRIDTR